MLQWGISELRAWPSLDSDHLLTPLLAFVGDPVPQLPSDLPFPTSLHGFDQLAMDGASSVMPLRWRGDL